MTCAKHLEDRPSAEYCFGCVKEAARQRCIDKGEGWRWGVGERPKQ